MTSTKKPKPVKKEDHDNKNCGDWKSCPHCGGKNYTKSRGADIMKTYRDGRFISRRTSYAGHYNDFHCEDCGFIQTDVE